MGKKDKFIDISYDVRNDSNGRDPDKYSRVLKSYHKKLWSKLLPNGKLFDLNDNNPSTYLYHKSELGEFFLSSDCIIHEYSNWKRMRYIIEKIPKDEMDNFLYLSYTIGGSIIFPSNSINSLPTINQARGCNKKICDRIDLTLECIRLYYLGKNSPLKDTLQRYDNFFKLFKNFQGYCEFFLLQDLTLDNYSKINFFLPFESFDSSPLPGSVSEYNEYKRNNIKFIVNRNKRIEEYDNQN